MEGLNRALTCWECESKEIKSGKKYQIKAGTDRQLYDGPQCGNCFSETKNTAIAGLRTPLSRIQPILNTLPEGMALNALCRALQVGKQSIYRWQTRLSELQPVLLVQALSHQFLQLLIEGDELYTQVHQHTEPSISEGWTIVLMDRASRFLWELGRGGKDRQLFRHILGTLAQVVEQPQDFSLLTDGERRYGSVLFEICSEFVRTGKRGPQKKVLRQGVKVRVKNKGAQKPKKGRKRPKYQAPIALHINILKFAPKNKKIGRAHV